MCTFLSRQLFVCGEFPQLVQALLPCAEQMAAHVAANFNLQLRRRLAAKMREKARNFLQSIERHPATLGQCPQFGIGQPAEPILNSIHLLDEHA